MDFKNINKEELLRLKKNLDEAFDNKIKDIEFSNLVESIDNLNFFKVNTLFESMLGNIFDDENGKKLIKKYADCIKENKGLKNAYMVFETLKKPNGADNASVYLNEAISFMKDAKAITEESLSTVKEIVKECANISKLGYSELSELINKENTLCDSLNFLMENKKTLSNVEEYSNMMNNIINFLNENKKETLFENEYSNLAPNVLIDKLNSIISESEEAWEKALLKEMSLCEMSGKDKSELFETYKTRCINKINESLNTDDKETKVRLESMKERLESKTYNKESEKEDLYNLAELENTL